MHLLWYFVHVKWKKKVFTTKGEKKSVFSLTCCESDRLACVCWTTAAVFCIKRSSRGFWLPLSRGTAMTESQDKWMWALLAHTPHTELVFVTSTLCSSPPQCDCCSILGAQSCKTADGRGTDACSWCPRSSSAADLQGVIRAEAPRLNRCLIGH